MVMDNGNASYILQANLNAEARLGEAHAKARKRAMNQAFLWAHTHDVGTLDGFMLVVGRFQHFYLTGEIMTP